MIHPRVYATFAIGFLLSFTDLVNAQGDRGIEPLPRPIAAAGRVDFLLRQSLRPPSDEADWQAIQLPDDWSVSRPDTRGVGWYRVKTHLEDPPQGVYLLYMPRFAASQVTAVVNGTFIGGTRGLPDPRSRLTPQTLVWSIPPALLQRGSNVIHLRVVADAGYREGLSRVYFGGAPEVSVARLGRERMQGLAHRTFGFVSIVLGLVAITVWFRQRGDSIIGWLGLSSIGAGLGPALYDVIGWEPSPALREALMTIYAYAFAPPLLMVLTRLGKHRATGLRIVSWGVLGLTFVVLAALGTAGSPAIGRYVGLFYSSAIVVAVAASWSTRRLFVGSSYVPLVVLSGAGLCAAVLFHDLAIWFGYLDFDRMASRPLIPATLALLTAVALLSLHLEAYGALRRSHSQLEKRVVERTRQLKENFERIRELERVESAAAERQRIVADMHDGLGGTLVRLLSLVKSDTTDRATLAGELEEALIELRLSLDSMEDFDHDLLVLLGAVRYRLTRSFELAGIQIDWQVEPVPRTAWLTPQRSHHLQRLLLEVFTNAIRHSRATKACVRVERTDDGRIRLSVADNGCGFDHVQGVPGRGIGNIDRRSATLNAELAIDTAPGRGTKMTLELPKEVLGYALADPSENIT